MNNHYDLIIVGAGISGLYSAYRFKQLYPHKSVLILEKSNYIGGRMGLRSFYGVNVTIGAGVGRLKKDYLLEKLLRDLDITYGINPVSKHFAPTVKNPISITKAVKILRDKYKSYKNPPSVTFKEFARKILGEDLYKDFVISAEYGDYENEDVHDSLYYYGFEDNDAGWKSMSINWNELLEKLIANIGRSHICINSEVNSVSCDDNQYSVQTKKNHYTCDKIIIASTVDTVRKLVPKHPIYRQIHGQPFLRVYGKFAKESSQILNEHLNGKQTIVPLPLRRIIPMNPSKGVYMIAYTDNAPALCLSKRVENTEKNRDYWCRLLEKSLEMEHGSLKLTSILDFYWKIGTHYYEPLDKDDFKTRKDFVKQAQRPMEGMFIVGEMISFNQGWSEGALESVETIIREL